MNLYEKLADLFVTITYKSSSQKIQIFTTLRDCILLPVLSQSLKYSQYLLLILNFN